jgi:hypothetical protein
MVWYICFGGCFQISLYVRRVEDAGSRAGPPPHHASPPGVRFLLEFALDRRSYGRRLGPAVSPMVLGEAEPVYALHLTERPRRLFWEDRQ